MSGETKPRGKLTSSAAWSIKANNPKIYPATFQISPVHFLRLTFLQHFLCRRDSPFVRCHSDTKCAQNVIFFKKTEGAGILAVLFSNQKGHCKIRLNQPPLAPDRMAPTARRPGHDPAGAGLELLHHPDEALLLRRRGVAVARQAADAAEHVLWEPRPNSNGRIKGINGKNKIHCRIHWAFRDIARVQMNAIN